MSVAALHLAPAEPCEPAPSPVADEVALLVARRGSGTLEHARFADLPRFLGAGDLLVVNTSATLPAALPGQLSGQPVELRLSTPAGDDAWVVELRTGDRRPFPRPPLGARVELPDGAWAELRERYRGSDRLTVARLVLGGVAVLDFLAAHGRPIRYAHAERERPLADHQTAFAREPGSAEMPSAAAPFTAELVVDLVTRGVLLAPLTLHTGVSSLEAGEAPYPERFAVPEATASVVNAVRGWGGRVIAVGTTVVRALESVARRDGTVAGGAGTTSLVVTLERGIRVVDGLVTGWHEPETSHLQMLEAVAGPALLERSYAAARAHGYRRHEFGDSHLILP